METDRSESDEFKPSLIQDNVNFIVGTHKIKRWQGQKHDQDRWRDKIITKTKKLLAGKRKSITKKNGEKLWSSNKLKNKMII